MAGRPIPHHPRWYESEYVFREYPKWVEAAPGERYLVEDADEEADLRAMIRGRDERISSSDGADADHDGTQGDRRDRRGPNRSPK